MLQLDALDVQCVVDDCKAMLPSSVGAPGVTQPKALSTLTSPHMNDFILSPMLERIPFMFLGVSLLILAFSMVLYSYFIL